MELPPKSSSTTIFITAQSMKVKQIISINPKEQQQICDPLTDQGPQEEAIHVLRQDAHGKFRGTRCRQYTRPATACGRTQRRLQALPFPGWIRSRKEMADGGAGSGGDGNETELYSTWLVVIGGSSHRLETT
ncbi:hypothetical protein B296_00052565 [Ensete ventricosum]|uniref:Uncharacterized protein n=1 Tax=Ensete ventricosum TaxID=4639 RepID=A0A426YBR6_ENSVE|nr:hypothetical protein B296_00052565 [Ensete ventricosum]